ncbi:unnamed protein product [Protopolystoma xenopodis]|uniref:Uncharacterized protein n=1 Tax=Protopolystoma xenopodis TaxID=117903 RepID=A0A3S5BS34_9PLAT|nr:unnamed protein product [Protopolystoma xenopodis]
MCSGNLFFFTHLRLSLAPICVTFQKVNSMTSAYAGRPTGSGPLGGTTSTRNYPRSIGVGGGSRMAGTAVTTAGLESRSVGIGPVRGSGRSSGAASFSLGSGSAGVINSGPEVLDSSLRLLPAIMSFCDAEIVISKFKKEFLLEVPKTK